MKKVKFQAVKGMQDIFPPESRRWARLEEQARQVCERYGYGEIRLPLLEPTGLFVRTIGEETDIVEKEMFTSTFGGKKSLTLRPEGTAGVVRAYLERKIYTQQSLARYFYFGPMFRRERPQAGRRRQFHQFGIEALGSANPALDVEAIDLLLAYLRAVGLENGELKINSVGCPRCRPDYQKELKKYLEERKEDLCENCRRRLETNVLRVLDCKNPSCRRIVAEAPILTDFLCSDCASALGTVRELLSSLSIDYQFDPRLVRGLDYYTRTVFEVYSSLLGAQDAVAAGGRYDNLIEDLGGPSLGAVGFSVGMERVLLCRGEKEIPSPRSLVARRVYLLGSAEKAFRLNFKFLSRLRRQGWCALIDYEERSFKAQLREANKLQADYALIRGEDEMSAGQVKLKNMETGEEELLSEEEALNKLRNPNDE